VVAPLQLWRIPSNGSNPGYVSGRRRIAQAGKMDELVAASAALAKTQCKTGIDTALPEYLTPGTCELDLDPQSLLRCSVGGTSGGQGASPRAASTVQLFLRSSIAANARSSSLCPWLRLEHLTEWVKAVRSVHQLSAGCFYGRYLISLSGTAGLLLLLYSRYRS